MSRLGKKIPICACVFTFSLKLEKWSFNIADLSRTGKKCTETITAREGRAKVLFLSINMQNLWRRRVVDLKLPNEIPSLEEVEG